MPTMITEFGVPSSIGVAHDAVLGRGEGDHSEIDAMRVDAELLRLIHDQGLAGGLLFEWADEWFRSSWNTAAHQDPGRRQLWHDPLTSGQSFGLLAMDAGRAADQTLIDADGAWPARRVSAQADESGLRLRVTLGGSPPGALQIGFDVLPSLTGTPMAGSTDRRPDAVFALNLVGRTGQAYLRDELDPTALDRVPESSRGPAPDGWKPFELLVDRARPVQLQNAGLLRYGDLWHADGDELAIRVPWALLGFADPSSHRVGVPRPPRLATQVSPGVRVSLTASGTDQVLGLATWPDWNHPTTAERLKDGAERFRDAALALTSG
jgi:hypothetical protein